MEELSRNRKVRRIFHAALILMLAISISVSGLFQPTWAAGREICCNVSDSYVNGNYYTANLPDSADSITAGDSLYFYMQTVDSWRATDAKLYIRTPDSGRFICVGGEVASNYIRYAYISYRFPEEGSYQYYWSVRCKDDGTTYTSDTKMLRVAAISENIGENSDAENETEAIRPDNPGNTDQDSETAEDTDPEGEYIGDEEQSFDDDAADDEWNEDELTGEEEIVGEEPSGEEGTVDVVQDGNGLVEISTDSAAEGEIVTVTVYPEESCELISLSAYDQDGNDIELQYESDTEYTFVMPYGSVTIEAVFSEMDAEETEPEGEPETGMETDLPKSPAFSDISSSAWYCDAVLYVCANGLMSGTGERTFGPDITTTRGMIVTILYRLAGEPEVYGSGFTDVPSEQYYVDAVIWAAENDIVNGYGNNRFGPNDPITREQMASILYRYAAYQGYDVSASADFSGFADSNEISSYAVSAMHWANAEGLINGINTSIIDPKGKSTRAQIATILMRFCETIA